MMECVGKQSGRRSSEPAYFYVATTFFAITSSSASA